MVAELSPSSNEKCGNVLNLEEVVEARLRTSLVLDGSSIVLCSCVQELLHSPIFYSKKA